LSASRFPFFATLGVLWITDRLVGLRVPPEEEEAGLDVGEHGEIAYGLLAEPDLALAAGPGAGEA
jgi:ammonia channel protein AmtB